MGMQTVTVKEIGVDESTKATGERWFYFKEGGLDRGMYYGKSPEEIVGKIREEVDTWRSYGLISGCIVNDSDFLALLEKVRACW